jgi:hypothetical protein|tara:strand:+ start:1221 stop:1457 length:237 start_codon:yes stop_codon:yes gene_type:complete
MLPNFRLGELVYMTNRLARGMPDRPFTAKNGPGMIVEVTERRGGFKPRYVVRWLKSEIEMEFHADSLMRVIENEQTNL